MAAGDVNNDGWPDFFLAANDGGNVLFLNDGHGKFREVPGSRRLFAWERAGGDNMICGACFADVNRDGLLDLVVGQHYKTPWQEPVPVRLFLNRGIQEGVPAFEDVTARVGLTPLAMKAPHVEVQDFDNDGWPDLYTSVVNPAGASQGTRSEGIMRDLRWTRWMSVPAVLLIFAAPLPAQQPQKRKAAAPLPYPPTLPGGKEVVTDSSADFLRPPATLKPGVAVAGTPPAVDFLYYPGQVYPGNPWSNWGDSLAADGKYYASIGDHRAPGGNAFVYEYDPDRKAFRQLTDVKKVLNLPEGHYTPGKIHSRIDQGADGCLYFATHRGSARATTDRYHYQGDWVLRCDPRTAKTEVVVRGPVPKHCIPNSVLDPDRLIFYGGTAAGTGGEDEGIRFFAYDVKNHRLLFDGPDGPSRYMLFARSTGRVYYVPGKGDGPLMRYDPEKGGAPVKLRASKIGLRAATQETPQGYVYTASLGQRAADASLWSFNTKTEEIKNLGPLAVGSQAYVASLDADPTGRYLYYVPGAHGSSDRDGAPVVQLDVRTGRKKVLAFLHPFYQTKYGCTLKGTYSSAVDPKGDKLYITWNVSRGSKAWDCCALTVVHIPGSERQP